MEMAENEVDSDSDHEKNVQINYRRPNDEEFYIDSSTEDIDEYSEIPSFEILYKNYEMQCRMFDEHEPHSHSASIPTAYDQRHEKRSSKTGYQRRNKDSKDKNERASVCGGEKRKDLFKIVRQTRDLLSELRRRDVRSIMEGLSHPQWRLEGVSRGHFDQPSKSVDVTDVFFQEVARIVKRLSPSNQTRVKLRIADIVSRIEERDDNLVPSSSRCFNQYNERKAESRMRTSKSYRQGSH